MRCHHHAHVEAIAICVSCGRAVCRDCFRSGVDGCTVCSPQCEDLAAKQKELMLVTAASYLSLAKVLTLLEIVCAVSGFAVLAWEYVLPAFNIRLGASEPAEAIGFACAFAMLGIVCWYAARVVRGIGNRLAAIDKQFPRERGNDERTPESS